MATYDYLKSKNGHKIQVESAKRDGAGKNIENNYAKQNGYYAQLTAGLADNLTPYSEDSGDLQENPFISNGTGTNNNQEIVTVGDYALIQEKQGNTICVNQYNNDGIRNYTENGITFSSTEVGGKFKISGTATAQASYYNYSAILRALAGHNVLIMINDCPSGIYFYNVGPKSKVITPVSNGSYGFVVNNGTQNVNYETPVYIFDLNQMFNNDQTIIADITANPSHFSWYYNGSLDYNTGSLESANGIKLVSTGRNLFDKSKVVEGKYMISTGEQTNSSYAHSDYIIATPNTDYYVKNITIVNYVQLFVCYDKDKNYIGYGQAVSGSGYHIYKTLPNTTYVIINIMKTEVENETLSLYYTPEQGGEGYDKYYPYEEPTVVDTGTEQLLSVGDARDYKETSGVIHRVVGTQNPTLLEWKSIIISGYRVFYATPDVALKTNTLNVVSAKYSTAGVSIYSMENKTTTGAGGAGGVIWIRDDSYSSAADFAASLTSNDTIYYELAEETTEQGTQFAETLPINDYGMLYWLDENDNLVGIPQGVKIFFPVNYKGFVDDVYSRTSGDAENLVVQSELAQYVKQVDLSDQITDAAGLTYSVKKAYKTGNVVSLSIRATNSTGSNIAADTELFDVGSDLRYGSTAMLVLGLVDATQCYFRINYSSGKCNCSQAIPNGSTIVLFTTYAVA